MLVVVGLSASCAGIWCQTGTSLMPRYHVLHHCNAF